MVVEPPSRDLIRVLAELFRSRGAHVPLLTPSDFLVNDDECGVLTLLDSFATTADQEHLREKAIRNLEALQAAGILCHDHREWKHRPNTILSYAARQIRWGWWCRAWEARREVMESAIYHNLGVIYDPMPEPEEPADDE